jgi:tryptophanyl-tRNA synthetase
MTQYKDKSRKQETIQAGLLTYPVLQAADILLYDADEVPVGEDQKQHVELSRDIAQRFNHLYGDTFKVPAPIIPKSGARVMGLDDPATKMSKSTEGAWHAVLLTDDDKKILKTFKRAVTDSGREIVFSDDPEKAGVNNLLGIYQAVTGRSEGEVLADFRNARGYGDLKVGVAEVVIEVLAPIRTKYEELISDPAELDRLLAIGADRASDQAERKVAEMKEKMGFQVP